MYSYLRNFFIVIIIAVVEVYTQTISFKHLTAENGLSNNDVNTLIQDRTGFIWFGTEEGLNRYDGYSFKIFRNDPEDSNSVSDNSIRALAEDRHGNLWIGTKKGTVDKFDPVTEKFTHWEIKSEITEENSILAIYEDSKKNIWIGTYKDGLYKLDLSSNNIDHWNHNPDDVKSLSHNYILDICEDNAGKIIVGTYNGLNVLNPTLPENGFTKYFNDPENSNTLSGNIIWGFSKSTLDPNVIWIGTYKNLSRLNTFDYSFETIEISNPDNLQFGSASDTVIEEIINGEKIIWTDSYSGLIRLNLSAGSIERFTYDEDNPNSLIDNKINKIIKDRSGVIWLATENGISYFTPKSTLFNYEVTNQSYPNILSELKKKNITAISKFSDGRIWIGTSDGLFLFENTYKPELKIITEFNGMHIWSLACLDEDELWVGTYGNGLFRYKYNQNKKSNFNLEDPRIRSQSVYYNKALLADNKKNIWVGFWGLGTARINPESGESKLWLTDIHNPQSLNNFDVWVIKQDQFGRIWLGTIGGGVNLFQDKDGGVFRNWTHKLNNKNSLSGNNIYSICEANYSKEINDSITILWIGTGSGLNKFVVKNKNSNPYDFEVEINSFDVSDGLSDNSINSILEDEKGNLWIGTNSGVSFFDVTSNRFTNFTLEDGLSGSVMNPESALKFDNGLMLFGSTKGLNIFNPDKIQQSTYKPTVVITDFQIFNESVKPGENSALKKSIINTEEIIIEHDRDVFSFEFAALDYNSSQNVKYAYKLDGFDQDWIYSNNRRFVTYTNLDPGTYTFTVKATNADGVWNEEHTSLKLTVKPPWWQTPWAYISYTILILLGLFIIRRFEINRTRLRNELKMRQFEVEQKTKLEEIKSRFFANLSHEFRTPLMLIKGPLEQLKNGLADKENYNENLALIERNSERLKLLIDQLLELSQLEKASIPVKARQENVVEILRGLISIFESLALQKNILLKFESDSEKIFCWVDRDKFEKIINNLLSNAFKFTQDGGEVVVKVQKYLNGDEQYCKIVISDNGIGIPSDKLKNIFNRFFQVADSSQRVYNGSGIGLALVKEFVDLHKWNISVSSEEKKGTEFTLNIPMWDDYLEEDKKVYFEPDIKSEQSDQLKLEQFGIEKSYKAPATKSRVTESVNKSSILIVDDSEDVRLYLSSLLGYEYNVSIAANGEEGIKSATEKLPDLIISDVMMPSMNGLEFCDRIKSDWKTSDIPVILLTAKVSFESKLEGLETGADDYLTKPFDSRELFTRINNLLEQRKRIRQKYISDQNFNQKLENLSTADDDFIKKTIDLIEANIDKVNFSTEQLANLLFLSRTQLHRKILAITGQPPGEYIRMIKLKKAAVMLAEKRLPVTQIAFEIGFSSPAQFTRAFKKQFDCLPSEYPSKSKN